MTDVKQQYKRLCFLEGRIEISFFSLPVAQSQAITANLRQRPTRITYKNKLKSVIAESCPCSPKPVLRVFGRFAPQPAPELKS
jgi:hypothetical protein